MRWLDASNAELYAHGREELDPGVFGTRSSALSSRFSTLDPRSELESRRNPLSSALSDPRKAQREV